MIVAFVLFCALFCTFVAFESLAVDLRIGTNANVIVRYIYKILACLFWATFYYLTH